MSRQLLDRTLKLPVSPFEIKSRYHNDEWVMTDAERSALYALLSELRPECAIEIGTYKAGSLGIISKFCKRVYTLDIDPSCGDLCKENYPNVKFIVGKSEENLPPLLEKIQRADEPLSFILIDADHSYQGVKRDIENVLKFIPKQPLYILMHDSFNPNCRKGILLADWSSNPHVHMVELDYIVGRFMAKDEGAANRQMWCGFALAILLPEPHNGEVIIHQNEKPMFQAAYRYSIYPYQKIMNLLKISKLKLLFRSLKKDV